MKKISILCFVMFCFLTSFSQKYNYGACFVNPNFIKLEGKIVITDSTVNISSIYKGVEKVNSYSVVKKVNGIIYITDGVMTHSIAMNSESGKKKGFEYDTLIILTFDSRQGVGQNMMYYSKLVSN